MRGEGMGREMGFWRYVVLMERGHGGGEDKGLMWHLQVEDLEKLAPQLVLDF